MSTSYYEESYPASFWGPVDLGSLNPISIVVNTPTPVTITGTGFTPASRVYVDGVYYPTTEYLSPTSIRFVAQGSSVGTQDVVVRNGSTQSDTLVLGVTATGTTGATRNVAEPAVEPQEPPGSQEAPVVPEEPTGGSGA